MAYLLSSERPAVAALPSNPLAAIVRWLEKTRAARSQRVALKELLEFDEHRLYDLGVTRADLFEAMHNPATTGARLAARRARSAKTWSGSI